MRPLFFLLCAFALGGCATWPQRSDANLSLSERTLIVKDCVTIMAEQLLPAKTDVCIVASESDDLTKDFQASLRAVGYAVSTDANAKSERSTIFAYALDRDTILLRVSVAGGWGADRLYRRNADGIAPLNGFTIRNGGTKNG